MRKSPNICFMVAYIILEYALLCQMNLSVINLYETKHLNKFLFVF